MQRVYLVYIFIVFTLASSLGSANQCIPTESLFDNRFSDLESRIIEAADDPIVYKPQVCYKNVRELYFEYLQPQYLAKDFKVLFIFKRSFSKDFPKLINPTQHGFMAKRQRLPAVWNYHVVLEYKGQIIDLDYPDAKLISKQEFKDNFYARDLDDLVLVTTSASDYFQSVHLQINPVLALQNFKKNGKKYSLSGYLDKK